MEKKELIEVVRKRLIKISNIVATPCESGLYDIECSIKSAEPTKFAIKVFDGESAEGEALVQYRALLKANLEDISCRKQSILVAKINYSLEISLGFIVCCQREKLSLVRKIHYFLLTAPNFLNLLDIINIPNRLSCPLPLNKICLFKEMSINHIDEKGVPYEAKIVYLRRFDKGYNLNIKVPSIDCLTQESIVCDKMQTYQTDWLDKVISEKMREKFNLPYIHVSDILLSSYSELSDLLFKMDHYEKVGDLIVGIYPLITPKAYAKLAGSAVFSLDFKLPIYITKLYNKQFFEFSLNETYLKHFVPIEQWEMIDGCRDEIKDTFLSVEEYLYGN